MTASVEDPSTTPVQNAARGRELFRARGGPAFNKPMLREQLFETSLEESNLVGNVYYANYYVFQGRIRDHFFQRIAPDYFRGTGASGELRCEHCRVDHLREAMPFDTIAVRMHLESVDETGAQVLFEYFRVNEDGGREKLAFGVQDIGWYAPAEAGAWRRAPWPAAFREALVRPAEALHAG
jgi:acyl-CoA thioesterase FadM